MEVFFGCQMHYFDTIPGTDRPKLGPFIAPPAQSGWWFSGALGDSVFTGLYPANAFRKAPVRNFYAWTWSASSMHPGGVNVTMADGSVRFVKDTVDLRPSDSHEATPPLGKARSGVGSI